MRLGYACINTELRKKKIFMSRSITVATLVEMTPRAAVERCRALVVQNLHDLQTILEWNEAHGIRFFRLSSNIFPHIGNHTLPARFRREPYFRGDIAFALPQLRKIGAWAREHNHRLTIHMTPYIQLGSPDTGIVSRSVFDIIMYTKTLRALATSDPCIILHGGGVYLTRDDTTGGGDACHQRCDAGLGTSGGAGTSAGAAAMSEADAELLTAAKQKTLARWLRNYRGLPLTTRRLIVLENDERHYGVTDLLPFCENTGIPLCFDVFHNSISAAHVAVTDSLVRRIVRTWPRGVVPKFHISEQDPDLGFGAHARRVARLPAWLRSSSWDVMVEAKDKEQAVIDLMKKYRISQK